MKFSQLSLNQSKFEIFLGNSNLNIVNSIKYLGIELNYNLYNKSLIKKKEKKHFYNNFNSILRKFYKVSILHKILWFMFVI